MSLPTFVIAGDFSPGDEGAPYARLRNFALGLAELGCAVQMIGFSGRRSNSRFVTIPAPDLNARGVSVYGWEVTQRHRSKVQWFWCTYRPQTEAMRQLEGSLSSAAVLLLYGRSYVRLAPLLRLARARGARIIWDTTEGIQRFGGLGGYLSPIYWDWVCGDWRLPHSVDLISAISSGLAKRYEGGRAKLVLIPGMECWQQQPNSKKQSFSKPFRLVVFGALRDKDAPELLTQLVAWLACHSISVSIELVGRYREKQASLVVAQRLLAMATSDTKIVDHGSLPRAEMEALFDEVDGMILLRPDTIAERLAFPTRLIELLKFRRPVVTSDVGDVSLYLRTGVDALVVVNEAELIGRQIAGLIAEPVRAAELGRAGWNRAAICFDRLRLCRKLLDAL